MGVGSTTTSTGGWLASVGGKCIQRWRNTQGGDNVVAVPVNFRQTGPGQNLGNGVLGFQYNWDSSTGHLSDLSACVVGEYVTYPGIGNYVWASPPYVPGYSSTNPTISNTSATGGVGNDTHIHPNFAGPYITNSFQAAQEYRWSCSNYNSGQWYAFTDYTISRSVQKDAGLSTWNYTVTKAGYSASVDPLP